jgi:hypothetical protein
VSPGILASKPCVQQRCWQQLRTADACQSRFELPWVTCPALLCHGSQSVAVRPPRRQSFDLTSLYVKFVADNVPPKEGFLWVLPFPPDSITPPILLCILCLCNVDNITWAADRVVYVIHLCLSFYLAGCLSLSLSLSRSLSVSVGNIRNCVCPEFPVCLGKLTVLLGVNHFAFLYVYICPPLHPILSHINLIHKLTPLRFTLVLVLWKDSSFQIIRWEFCTALNLLHALCIVRLSNNLVFNTPNNNFVTS